MTQTGIIEVKKRRLPRKGYYWRLLGLNNEVVCTSHPQSFEHPTDARAAAKRACEIAVNPEIRPL